MKLLKKSRNPHAHRAVRDRGWTDIDRLLWSRDFERLQFWAFGVLLALTTIYFASKMLPPFLHEVLKP